MTDVMAGCHILPFAIGSRNPKQRHLWALLRCFWTNDTINLVIQSCEQINRYGNGISMIPDAHQMFDDLKFYLEPLWDTLTPTNYTVRFNWVDRRPLTNRWGNPKDMETGDLITFSTTNPVQYPLPDPAFIYIHMMVAMLQFPRGGGIIEEDDLWYHGPDEVVLEDDNDSTASTAPSTEQANPESSWESSLDRRMETDLASPKFVQNQQPSFQTRSHNSAQKNADVQKWILQTPDVPQVYDEAATAGVI